MKTRQSELQTASSNLTRTLSSVALPGRVSDTSTDSQQEDSVASYPRPSLQPRTAQESNSCLIPESFGQEGQLNRSKLIGDFLKDIQSTVNAQVCSIFLIDDNGHLKREGIIGFDMEGQPIDTTLFIAEEYPLDGTSAVGKTAQPGNDRYGAYLYIDSIHDNSPDFVSKDKLKEYEALFGRIDSAVYVPIHGPNSTYGVLRVFNKVNVDKKPNPEARFSSDEQIYLAQAAAYFGTNLRELRKNQDQQFSLVLQNNILLDWADINRKVLCIETSDQRSVHDEIFSIYQSILRHLARRSDSYVKSAILRLIRSDNKLVYVSSHTRDEDDYRDNQPRQMPQLDRGATGTFSLVGEVAQTGKNLLIRDIASPDSIELFINQQWIKSNNLQDFFCIALRVNNNTIGTLSLFTGKNRHLALEDQRYLEGISNLIGLYTSLIFSSPYVAIGKIDQKYLDSFLCSLSPPQAINLSTLLLEDASPIPSSNIYRSSALTNNNSPSFQISRLANNPTPRRTVTWGTRMGRRMKPRYSPENIWFTVRQISREAHLPSEMVSDVLENNPAFVRAANLEAENSEPVYASRAAYNRKISPIGKIKSILLNRVVG